ncbi:MFS transporter [Ilumatobacter sp.]|uniref:MFS transporter n=1 Tax=Ilumatobacter sp. TaxID=1967498 RepID=UPI003753CD92
MPTPRSRVQMRLLPASASADAKVLLQTRGIRAFGDGVVSIALTTYLLTLGLSTTQTGVVITSTLLGSAALTMFVGLRANAYRRRRLLQAMSLLMVATGVGFAVVDSYWLLIVVAAIGTLNPSGGDVSAFLPTEQALLPATVDDSDRTAVFARYSLVGSLVAAFGAAVAGVPEWIANRTDHDLETALRWIFVGYALLGLTVLIRYRKLSPAIESAPGAPGAPGAPQSALGESRRIVYRLALLFSLDSLGGGFTLTAILVLWLKLRFDLSLAVSGAIFFWAGLLSAFSQLLAVGVSRRIGLVRTMVFTHLPANGFLVLAAFMPNAPLAVTCLLARAALSQMDVPARSSYVMAVVAPEERPAAASITGVPRSLAGALPPIAAGWMLDHSTFGWPLIIAGTLKATYDLLLLAMFRNVRPPEESEPARPT